jgi:octaprenyl-diphosphate synthase
MDRLSQIKAPIVNDLSRFQQVFDDSLSTSDELLNGVLTHVRKKQGKMMRPILVLLTAKLFGSLKQETLFGAVSLELLHTASLVHDDVVDESGERRGQPSVNAVYNNKVAVLVGDYLLASSLSQASLTRNRTIIDVIAHLGQSLSEGELLQLSNIENPEFSEKIYLDIILKKTAALFAACTQVGLLSAATDENELTKARQLGEYIGLCFQIRDDLFDYYDSEEIGKPTGNDMLEGKLTLPVLYVLNKMEDKSMNELALRVKQGTATADEIEVLVRFTKENGGIEYAEQVMLSYKKQALLLLEAMPDTDVKRALVAYVDYVVERKL